MASALQVIWKEEISRCSLDFDLHGCAGVELAQIGWQSASLFEHHLSVGSEVVL